MRVTIPLRMCAAQSTPINKMRPPTPSSAFNFSIADSTQHLALKFAAHISLPSTNTMCFTTLVSFRNSSKLRPGITCSKADQIVEALPSNNITGLRGGRDGHQLATAKYNVATGCNGVPADAVRTGGVNRVPQQRPVCPLTTLSLG